MNWNATREAIKTVLHQIGWLMVSYRLICIIYWRLLRAQCVNSSLFLLGPFEKINFRPGRTLIKTSPRTSFIARFRSISTNVFCNYKLSNLQSQFRFLIFTFLCFSTFHWTMSRGNRKKFTEWLARLPRSERKWIITIRISVEKSLLHSHKIFKTFRRPENCFLAFYTQIIAKFIIHNVPEHSLFLRFQLHSWWCLERYSLLEKMSEDNRMFEFYKKNLWR
jgi:hypothetical protein